MVLSKAYTGEWPILSLRMWKYLGVKCYDVCNLTLSGSENKEYLIFSLSKVLLLVFLSKCNKIGKFRW